MNTLRKFRWCIVTFTGCVYCLLAPLSFYRRRK